MKKLWMITLLSVITCDLSAQKWLKSIGKALNKVEKVAEQLTNSENGQTQAGLTSNSKSTVFTYGDVKVTTTLPSFTISVNEVKRISLNCGTISLTLTNTSSEDVRLYGLSVMKSLTDSKGNDYSGYGKWEMKIGNQTIRRYGTDDDYTFPAGQAVNAVWYIYGLPGTVTTETEKVGSFMKTTTRMPSVTIQSFALEPNIVYQKENTRRHYTLEMTGIKIPAYVHIDREGIGRNVDSVKTTVIPTAENKGAIITTAGDSTETVIPICAYPGNDDKKTNEEKNNNETLNGRNPNEDDVKKEKTERDSVDNKDSESDKKNEKGQKDQTNDTPPGDDDESKNDGPKNDKGTGNPLPPVQPKDTIFIIKPSETEEESQWRARIQPILDRQVLHLELRSDVHYTNEPRGDWGDCLRFTAISLSSAEYERFDGIFFEYVDPELQFKTNKERHIAQCYSSYPRQGTKCGIITNIASEYKKGMTKQKRDGIPYYVFQTNTLTLDKIEETGFRDINGVTMKVVIFSVIDSPTAFGLAYDRAIMKKQTRKTEHLLCGLFFAYNKNTDKWEAKGGTKYNPKTQKWEVWYLV